MEHELMMPTGPGQPPGPGGPCGWSCSAGGTSPSATARCRSPRCSIAFARSPAPRVVAVRGCRVSPGIG